MPFVDKTLTCVDCGQQFTFTADDQEFFASRGFGEPKRCRSCRANRRNEREGGGGGGGAMDAIGAIASMLPGLDPGAGAAAAPVDPIAPAVVPAPVVVPTPVVVPAPVYVRPAPVIVPGPRFRAMALGWNNGGGWIVKMSPRLADASLAAVQTCNTQYGGCALSDAAVAPTAFGCLVVAQSTDGANRLFAAAGNTMDEARAAADSQVVSAQVPGQIVYAGCNG